MFNKNYSVSFWLTIAAIVLCLQNVSFARRVRENLQIDYTVNIDSNIFLRNITFRAIVYNFEAITRDAIKAGLNSHKSDINVRARGLKRAYGEIASTVEKISVSTRITNRVVQEIMNQNYDPNTLLPLIQKVFRQVAKNRSIFSFSPNFLHFFPYGELRRAGKTDSGGIAEGTALEIAESIINRLKDLSSTQIVRLQYRSYALSCEVDELENFNDFWIDSFIESKYRELLPSEGFNFIDKIGTRTGRIKTMMAAVNFLENYHWAPEFSELASSVVSKNLDCTLLFTKFLPVFADSDLASEGVLRLAGIGNRKLLQTILSSDIDASLFLGYLDVSNTDMREWKIHEMCLSNYLNDNPGINRFNENVFMLASKQVKDGLEMIKRYTESSEHFEEFIQMIIQHYDNTGQVIFVDITESLANLEKSGHSKSSMELSLRSIETLLNKNMSVNAFVKESLPTLVKLANEEEFKHALELGLRLIDKDIGPCNTLWKLVPILIDQSSNIEEYIDKLQLLEDYIYDLVSNSVFPGLTIKYGFIAVGDIASNLDEILAGLEAIQVLFRAYYDQMQREEIKDEILNSVGAKYADRDDNYSFSYRQIIEKSMSFSLRLCNFLDLFAQDVENIDAYVEKLWSEAQSVENQLIQKYTIMLLKGSYVETVYVPEVSHVCSDEYETYGHAIPDIIIEQEAYEVEREVQHEVNVGFTTYIFYPSPI